MRPGRPCESHRLGTEGPPYLRAVFVGVGDKWNGQHVDTMISTLGPPPAESTLTDGSRILEWRSYEGLGYDKQWCTVRVAVDPSGQIVSVAQSQKYACAFFLGRF